MNEPVHPVLSSSFQEHMCPIYVRVGEFIRIAETEVNVRLRREMEDGVYFVLAQYALDVGRRGYVAILKREIWLCFENARVVQGRTVVELVVRHDIVMVGVREDKMANKPAGTV